MRAAIISIVLFSVSLPFLLLIDHPIAWILTALCVTGFPVALIALSTDRSSHHRTVRFAIALLASVLFASVATLIYRHWTHVGESLPGAAGPLILLMGIWLVPFLIIGIAYAMTFHSATLDERELDHFRRRYVKQRSSAQESPPTSTGVPL